ncbi:MAG: GTPase Era [Candidatus Woesearchaeota archaeon]|jgi:GTP-binding protein Era
MKSLVMPVVGLPNVGKSTIINAVLGRKVSIVTHKPHTTRSMIFGTKQFDGAEVVFVDTPGIQKVNTKLGNMIFESMKEYLLQQDEVLLILDASRPEIEKFESIIPKSIIVLNKIDRLRKPKLLPLVQKLKEMGAKEVFFTSANLGDGIAELSEYLKNKMQDEEEHDFSTVPEDVAYFACECVREKILVQFDEEIPYKVWIEPVSIKLPKDSAWHIELNIVVPKASYKPMLLGKKGECIKSIGVAARAELTAKFKQSGYLGLKIIVDEKLWNKDYVYSRLGWMKK